MLSLVVALGCSSTRMAMGPAKILPGVKTTTSVGDHPVTVVAGVTGDSLGREIEVAHRDDRVGGRISGQVVDDRGQPVPEAEIRLADGGRPFGRARRARTDAAGRFTLHDLHPGSRYTLIADDGRAGRFGRAVAEAPDGDVLIRLDPATELGEREPEPDSKANRQRIDRVSERRKASEFEAEPSMAFINPDDLPAAETPDMEIATVASRGSGRGTLAAPPAGSRGNPRSGWRAAGPVGLEPLNTEAAAEPEASRSAFGLPIEEDDFPNPLPPAIEGPAPEAPPAAPRGLDAGSVSRIEPYMTPAEDQSPGDLEFPATSEAFPEPVEPIAEPPVSRPNPTMAPRPAAPEPVEAVDPSSDPATNVAFPAAANARAGDLSTHFPEPTGPPQTEAPASSQITETDESAGAPTGLVPPTPSDQPKPEAIEEVPPIPPPGPESDPSAHESESPALPDPAAFPEATPADEAPPAIAPPRPPASDTETEVEPPSQPEPIADDLEIPADAFQSLDPPEPARSKEVEGPAPASDATAAEAASTESAEPPAQSEGQERESADDFVAGPSPIQDEAAAEKPIGGAPPLEEPGEESPPANRSEAPVGSFETPGAGTPQNSPPGLVAEVPQPPRPTWRELTLQGSVRRAHAYPPSMRRSAEPTVAPEGPAIAEESRKGRFGLALLAGKRDQDTQRAACEFDERRNRLVDFTLPDLQGRPVRFRDLDADYLLLDFWGTWCGPCVRSIPHLVQLQNRYDPGRLRVIGVAYEQAEPAEGMARVERAVRELGINYSILLAEQDRRPCPLAEALKIQAYPTLILLDRHGRILWRESGGSAQTLERLDRVIAANTRARAGVVRR